MIETSVKIAAVVVTYNRKNLLIECLKAIIEQSQKPNTVFIIDNASTDGTCELLKKHGLLNAIVNDIELCYILLPYNQGGAGGFYCGIKKAYESPKLFDAVWVMDDDGIPDKECLKNLTKYLPQFDYIAPLVLSKENPRHLAFHFHGISSVDNLQKTFGDVVPDYACPFNGILYSRKLIEKIGYPLPHLFIWGDEANYHLRALDTGFKPVTVLDAIHQHPKDRMVFDKSIFGKKIVAVPNLWKGYCFWRNVVYNFKDHASIKQYITFYIYNAWYYLFIKRKWTWFWCFNKAYFSGFKTTPDEGYRKYMK